MSLRAAFLRFDDELASHGVPPLTAWWRAGVGEWLDAYEQGHVLELWACAGRGSAKSTVLYKLAAFFTLFGDFDVPPGERHYAIVLSRLREEAEKGIKIIGRWLTMLGHRHRSTAETIDLVEDPSRGIRVVAASVAATSGWRAFAVFKDERSKFPEDGNENLDAEEIDTSAAAMTATHPYAPTVSVGSAWGMQGAFYDAIMSGTDDTKHVLGPMPTWIAAPHIREEDCRRKERDPKRFAREYECVFQATTSGAFDVVAVDLAFKPRYFRGPVIIGAPTIVIDASGLKEDAFTWGCVRWLMPPNRRYRMEQRHSAFAGGLYWDFVYDRDLKPIPIPENEKFPPTIRFDWVRGVEGGVFGSNCTADKVVDAIAKDYREHAAIVVVGDQRESYGLAALFAQREVQYRSIAWTATSKPRAVEIVRGWMRDHQLWLPHESHGETTRPHEKLRSELLSFEEKLTPSGQITFNARGKQHDDLVALLVTAAMAEQHGLLSLSPSAQRVRRHVPAGFCP